MSNERLERIKERVNYHGHLDDDIEFLIKQTELVQILESRVARERHYKLAYRKIARRYQSESGRYRKALEFYANRGNYEPIHFDPDTVEYMSAVENDEGLTARKALEETK